MSAVAKDLTSYRKYWAARFGVAPFLPMLKQSRTVDALRAQHRQRASAARIAWHTLTRKGLAKLPPAKP